MAPEKSIISEYPDLLGAGLVILVAGITIFGIQGSAWVNNFFTGLNMIVIVMITVFMFIFADFNYLLLPVPYANYSLIHGSGGDGLVQHPLIPDGVFLPFGISGLIAGASTCFYCFIGFDVISTCAEETANPARDIPRANMIAVLLVAITISFCALSLVVYVPWYTVDINAPYMLALIGGKQIGGGSLSLREGFYYFVGIGCLLGLTGSLLSNTIAGPRIIYSMGQDRIVYKAFAYVCEPFKVTIQTAHFIQFTSLPTHYTPPLVK
ncbi:unnamed protein product [Protopolystoma xenopodis]|uniref:Amino acid permease/ SLC12A domain-containing protein n=1 Tax=Protopolystoma xenopodis TaxID=117903 RepID=A0A3S5FGL0_9PLAT|nr:unnamed protein product [Protopolystoma xenopodis]